MTRLRFFTVDNGPIIVVIVILALLAVMTAYTSLSGCTISMTNTIPELEEEDEDKPSAARPVS